MTTLVTSEAFRAGSLERLLSAKEIMISTGSGGVGKTTVAAAAAAMSAVHFDGKVLVLTVDPARRLANALGLEQFGNIEKRVPAAAFEQAGVDPRGELWAAMLDTKQSWDDLVQMDAPDDETRDASLDNLPDKNGTGKSGQSPDSIPVERLFEIHTSGRYDLIVVDTPPTRNAIDFLEAPERMADFFSSRLLRWLIAPYRSRVISMASRPFYNVADRILGTQFLEDIAEFFILFQTMYEGFVERAQAVTRLLASSVTTFAVVSTLESAPIREAEFFIELLRNSDYHLGAVILNKALPPYLLDRQATDVARRMSEEAAPLTAELSGPLGIDAHLEQVLVEVGENFLNFQVVAEREAEERAEMGKLPDVVASVPYFDQDIYDLAGLLRMGRAIWW